MAYNPAIAKLQMPARIARLPVDERGYPVPKFVATIDGKPDFRLAKSGWVNRCITGRLCWQCGEPIGRHLAFVIGPMCAINRVSSEPPSHLDCAQFAVKACPFLTQPKRPRNPHGLPEDKFGPGGVMIPRNPGVTLIWVTKRYRLFRSEHGNAGTLIHIGEPEALYWYSHGREATHDEIMASIDSGLPALREVAEMQGPDAIAALDAEIARGLALVPP